MSKNRDETPVRILAPESGCITLKCGHRLIEVCAGEDVGKTGGPTEGDGETVFPAIAMRGPIDIHDLDVDWAAGKRQMVIRPIE